MKVAQYSKYGGPEVIGINNDAPKPTIKKGQVLVEVYAASINPIDWKVRAGYLKEVIPMQFPVTIGSDFSGKVVEVDEEVPDYKVGDEVFGQSGPFNGGSGSFAEFAAANKTKLSSKPNELSFVEAAALPLAGSSALQGISEHIKLRKGQKILIHGGAGGVGSLAIQVAKSIGAYVATTVSVADIEFVKSLGADEAIDYKSEDFSEKLSGFDAVFDTVGGEVTGKSFNVLARGGIIVSMVGAPSEALAKQYRVTAIGQNTDSKPEHFKKLAEMVIIGKLKAIVDRVFSLDQAREAFIHQEQNHPRGKVVVKVKS